MTPYVDIKVNGFAGVDFNADDLTPESLHRACQALEQDGAAAILATIITDHLDLMSRRLRRLTDLRAKDPLAQRLIAGLHIEGPFINESPGYRGAHPADAIHPASPSEMSQLLDAAGGLTKLVTLAPERDANLQVTKLLINQSITVSAGHSSATLDQLDAAIDAGLSMWTHLGNGCPKTLDRHDNVIERALSRHHRLWLCFIADGVHIPFFALKNYLEIAAPRAIVVSDAITAATLGPGRHRIGRWTIDVDENLAAWAPDKSHLVGSAMPLSRGRQNLHQHLHLDDSIITRLTTTNPLTAVNLLPVL
ncbi:MAG: N-acetylglucosamine-6-phosphate deacetylase [Phycisphaeraceae bacterium]|nr:N-acetylglucosamine-6-phosphate deacetylase [Phycisphaeraceae bacterium]